jgi:hypothetical protein
MTLKSETLVHANSFNNAQFRGRINSKKQTCKKPGINRINQGNKTTKNSKKRNEEYSNNYTNLNSGGIFPFS